MDSSSSATSSQVGTAPSAAGPRSEEYLVSEANAALSQLREWRRGEGQLAMGSDLRVNTTYLETHLVDHPHREAVIRTACRLMQWSRFEGD